MKENKVIFVSALQNNKDIPEKVKSRAESVIELVKTTLDKSYFEFLDEEIKLCARGEEWNKVLKTRKKALSPFCNKDLLRGRIQYKSKDFIIRIDPKKKSVVHWEESEIKEWRAAINKRRGNITKAALLNGMCEEEAESAADDFENAARKGLDPKQSEDLVKDKIKEGKKGKVLSNASVKETEKLLKEKKKN